MAHPTKNEEDKLVMITSRFTRTAVAAMDDMCADELFPRTRSEFIRDAVEFYMRERRKQG